MQDIDNGYVFLKVVDSDKTLDATNHIKGALADKVNDKNAVTAGKVPYTLQPHAADNGLAVAFMQYEGSSLEGFRAYLELDPTVAQSISIRFGAEEGTTDIENVELSNQNSAFIYDLFGRRVETMTKGGIYIVNGKKVVVK